MAAGAEGAIIPFAAQQQVAIAPLEFRVDKTYGMSTATSYFWLAIRPCSGRRTSKSLGVARAGLFSRTTALASFRSCRRPPGSNPHVRDVAISVIGPKRRSRKYSRDNSPDSIHEDSRAIPPSQLDDDRPQDPPPVDCDGVGLCPPPQRLPAWMRRASAYLGAAARLRNATTSVRPARSAASSGVRPWASFNVKPAPSATSASTDFILPIAAAM